MNTNETVNGNGFDDLIDPEHTIRTRTGNVSAYVDFITRIENDMFDASCDMPTQRVMIRAGYQPPYMSFCIRNAEIIDNGTFPGSPHYWHAMLIWGWDMLRGYNDRYWEDANSDSLNAALKRCKSDMVAFLHLLERYA